MDTDKLFDPHTEVKFDYRGAKVIYTYRDPDSAEWLEYQRRASSFNVRKKTFVGTGEALGARLWLHQKIRVKVEAMNGTGARETIEDKFPPHVQDQAMVGFLNQLQASDDEGN